MLACMTSSKLARLSFIANGPQCTIHPCWKVPFHLSLHARACVSNILATDPIRFNASSVCPLERERLFWFSSLGCVRARCHKKFSFSTFQDGTTEGSQHVLTKQQTLRGHFNRSLSVLNARVALLSHSYSCTVVAFFFGSFGQGSGLCELNFGTFCNASPFCVKRLPQVSLTI